MTASDAILRIILARHLYMYPVIILVPNRYIAFFKIPNIILLLSNDVLSMSADIFSCGSVLKKQTSIKYWHYIIDFISTNFLL